MSHEPSQDETRKQVEEIVDRFGEYGDYFEGQAFTGWTTTRTAEKASKKALYEALYSGGDYDISRVLEHPEVQKAIEELATYRNPLRDHIKQRNQRFLDEYSPGISSKPRTTSLISGVTV